MKECDIRWDLANKRTQVQIEMHETIRKPSNFTWNLGTMKSIVSKVEFLEKRKVKDIAVRMNCTL
jgi:uncharacterized protein YajQ (UPF0234 family)